MDPYKKGYDLCGQKLATKRGFFFLVSWKRGSSPISTHSVVRWYNVLSGSLRCVSILPSVQRGISTTKLTMGPGLLSGYKGTSCHGEMGLPFFSSQIRQSWMVSCFSVFVVAGDLQLCFEHPLLEACTRNSAQQHQLLPAAEAPNAPMSNTS